MNEAFLYQWIDKTTNKKYIGIHKGAVDDGYICSSKVMLEEYVKRPMDFQREILYLGSFDDMVMKETELLKNVNAAKNPEYYNMHNGDGNFYNKGHTEETKKKISKKNKGNSRPDLAERNRRGLSLTTRKKISKNHHDVSGCNNPMFGKTHSEETKKRISEKKKNDPFLKLPKSEETRLKMSLARKKFWEIKKGNIL
jgi:hypothetical protein